MQTLPMHVTGVFEAFLMESGIHFRPRPRSGITAMYGTFFVFEFFSRE